MRHALIDLGSNTIRLVMYDADGNNVRQIFNEKEAVGIISYVEDGNMLQEGIERLVEVLERFKGIADNYNVDTFNCFATASLRNIANTGQVVDEIRKAAEIEVEVITGEEEAALDFIGAREALSLETGLAVDVGGGSTEIIAYRNGLLERCTSLPFGSLRLYNTFVENIFPTKKQLKDIKEFVRSELENIEWLDGFQGDTLCVIGGTARAVGKLHKKMVGNKGDIHRYTFSAIYFNLILKTLMNMGQEGFKYINKVIPERVHTIMPGLIVFKEIVKKCGIKQAVISNWGVREGYLINKILSNEVK